MHILWLFRPICAYQRILEELNNLDILDSHVHHHSMIGIDLSFISRFEICTDLKRIQNIQNDCMPNISWYPHSTESNTKLKN